MDNEVHEILQRQQGRPPLPAGAPLQTYSHTKKLVTHDAVIDFVITNPTATYREIAGAFGYTPEGIGVICRSDAFRARLEVRKEELVDPIIKQNVEQRLIGLAHASIDILQRKLATSDDPKLALASLDAATKAAQYGARGANGAGGGVTFVVQLPGPATNSAEWSSKFGPAQIAVQQAVVEEAAVIVRVEPSPQTELF